jgi:RES domain-containing protein
VLLYRCFAWSRRARPVDRDGPLWFPRELQGEGRHDNPDSYGCLYVTDRPVSAVVEQLARFRGQRLTDGMLVRRRLPLALGTIELPDDRRVVDLDDPAVLAAHELRPSLVATRRRPVTQPQALELFRRHRRAAALRWWSTYEALWANFTVFDRSAAALRLADVRRLRMDDQDVVEAADVLGIT